MRKIFDIIDKMVSCVTKGQSEYRAYAGFSSEFIDRAVTKKAVYITVEEVRFKEIDFVIYVYSPVSLGGTECVWTACEVNNILSEGGFCLQNVTVGGAEYNRDSQGFLSKIKGTVEDNSLDSKGSGAVECIAVWKYENDIVTQSFNASRCKILCVTGDYPIMTVFSGKPIDVVKGVRSYKIVFDGVVCEDIERLISGEMIELNISDIGRVFKECCCERFEKGVDDEITMTFIGY